MEYITSFIKKYYSIIVTIIILILIVLYVRREINLTKATGIITIAKVVRYEGAESGGDLFIDIYYKEKVYNTSIDFFCRRCTGKYFFIKVKKNAPTRYPIFYGDKEVPECIIKNIKYFNGWKDFPTCDNYADMSD